MAQFITLRSSITIDQNTSCDVNVDHISFFIRYPDEDFTSISFNTQSEKDIIRVFETPDEIREMISPSPLKVEDPTIDLF